METLEVAQQKPRRLWFIKAQVTELFLLIPIYPKTIEVFFINQKEFLKFVMFTIKFAKHFLINLSYALVYEIIKTFTASNCFSNYNL